MGLSVEEDLSRCAVVGQDLEYLAHPRVVDPGVELAVGVGARAPFAEQQVALRVERVALEKPVPLARAFGDLEAPLDDDGLEPRLDQSVGCEETRGAGAYDHRRFAAHRPPHRPDLDSFGCAKRLDPRRDLGKQRALRLGRDVDGQGVEQSWSATPSGIDRPLDDVADLDPRGFEVEELGADLCEIVLVLVERERQIAEQDGHDGPGVTVWRVFVIGR